MPYSKHMLSTSRRAAVDDMPLVDMIAMSKRSAIRAALRISVKPSFSDNGNFEAQSRSFGTCFSYASRFALPLTRKAGFRLAG
jgi:hypothetical protein